MSFEKMVILIKRGSLTIKILTLITLLPNITANSSIFWYFLHFTKILAKNWVIFVCYKISDYDLVIKQGKNSKNQIII